MSLVLEELRKARGVIIRFTLVLAVFFFGLITLAPRGFDVGDRHVTMLLPGTPSLATTLFLSAKESLIPPGVAVVALGPVAPFVAPITMAFLVSLLIALPFGLYFLTAFLWPALQLRERVLLALILIPSLALFYAGCALAYFFIIPQTFSILYAFAEPVEVMPLFALDDFISSVFFLTISVGSAFLLPVFMAGASRIGILDRGFWTHHFRIAIVLMILFSAVVTPDGSGVTMVLLAIPLIMLYILGILISKRRIAR